MYLPRDIWHDFTKCEHVNLRREWTLAVFKELYYAANDQKMADKKNADYQEGRRAVLTVQHEAVRATWKTWRKVVHEAAKVTWRIWKSRAESAALSCESYKNDLEKSRDDSAAWSHESYLKDPEKRRARNHESYMKDPEKSGVDSAARSSES